MKRLSWDSESDGESRAEDYATPDLERFTSEEEIRDPAIPRIAEIERIVRLE